MKKGFFNEAFASTIMFLCWILSLNVWAQQSDSKKAIYKKY